MRREREEGGARGVMRVGREGLRGYYGTGCVLQQQQQQQQQQQRQSSSFAVRASRGCSAEFCCTNQAGW